MPINQTPLISTTCDQGESLVDLVADLETGRLTCVGLVQRCLHRIDKLEEQVRAWVMVDQPGALKAAAEADLRRSSGTALSRLDGIPVGVKDIIDVAGWPTVAAFEPWTGRVAAQDAAIVGLMRQAGLVPLGKTVTTQFAAIDPPPTRNPWDLKQTPGGSSSGSCAAVACGMVPLALGSQTGGSINRPASYCGVTGLKLAFGEWPVQGVVPCSPSLDTLGPIVRRPGDLRLVLEALAPQHIALESTTLQPPRVMVLGGRFHELADAQMHGAVEQAARSLQQAGCEVSRDEAAGLFTEHLWGVHRTIMMRECFLTHQALFKSHAEAYLPKVRGWVELGQSINDAEYDQAQLDRGRLMSQFARTYHDSAALLLPAARGAAPGPETTGDPVLNAPWTLLGLPSLTVPVRLSSQGLPLAVQLVAPASGANALARLIQLGTSL